MLAGLLKIVGQVFLGLVLAWFVSWGFRAWWIPYPAAGYVGHVFGILCAGAAGWLILSKFRKSANVSLTQENGRNRKSGAGAALIIIPFAYFIGYQSIGNAISALYTRAAGDPHTISANMLYLSENRGRGSSWCHRELHLELEGATHSFCVDEERYAQFNEGESIVLEGAKTKLGFKIEGIIPVRELTSR